MSRYRTFSAFVLSTLAVSFLLFGCARTHSSLSGGGSAQASMSQGPSSMPSAPKEDSLSATPNPMSVTNSTDAGVQGRLLHATQCPYQSSSCAGGGAPPGLITGDVEAVRSNGVIAGRTHARSDGRFRITLAAGRYSLVAHVSGSHCSTVTVTVYAHGFTPVDINCT